ncbi:4-hydroxy-tetrahydrodipicolinate synthase [Breznakiella homolactica]|uniref:4-hydroxy-tetrahydrodipicolinate synthase n=1 Tax=Breznakiella homolactica TaxID=2798577 RepID=A0A7T7XQP9_9SPIR|nr:4-hydroxy-tetrahydrodipicolinate synthase [Breznakiella homolactica]QQO10736.1 4-hydroxy-tetrahydrodipicolinate synthase [Breznakiella homolactica]
MSFIPRGIIPAVVTPMTPDEQVDHAALRRIIRFLLEGGVHGIFVIGTTGEFYAMTQDEKRALIETTVDETAGKVPVYAGTGAITTKECIALTKMAESCGVDAVSILTPMFISPSQDDLYEHYRIIASETELPIILYNNVPRTGVTISAGTVEKLSRIPNIVGIKDSSGDFTLTAEYIRLTRYRKEFAVLQGRDTQILAGLQYGATGAIAACANVAPRLCCEIYDRFQAGDYAGSLEAQFALAPLRLAFNIGTFPAVIKEALNMLGLNIGGCVKPIRDLLPNEKAELQSIMKEMKLI